MSSGDASRINPCLHKLIDALGEIPAEIAVVRSTAAPGNLAVEDDLRASFPAIGIAPSDPGESTVTTINRSVATASGELILFVDTEATISAEAIDLLLSVARRFPWAGLYGAHTQAHSGWLDRPSVLGRHAATRRRAPRTYAHDSRTHARDLRTHAHHPRASAPQIRAVKTLRPPLLLLRSDAWTTLGGLTEHPPHGDCWGDLCIRARRSGFTPLLLEADSSKR